MREVAFRYVALSNGVQAKVQDVFKKNLKDFHFALSTELEDSPPKSVPFPVMLVAVGAVAPVVFDFALSTELEDSPPKSVPFPAGAFVMFWADAAGCVTKPKIRNNGKIQTKCFMLNLSNI